MDVSQDETERAVAELADQVLGRELETVQPGDGEPGYPEAAWKALAQAGLLSLAVPAELGGDGLGVREIAVVLTAAGRHAAPLPVLPTVALGVLPIARLGSHAQRAELLADVGSGTRVYTAAMREPGLPDPAACRAHATRDGAGFLVSGTKTGVPFAGAAHRILLPVRIDGAGRGILLLDPAADGVAMTSGPSSSGSPEFTLRLDEVRVPADALLGDDDTGHAVVEAHRLAIAGICATADGALTAAMDLTAGHLRTREQFGKPLATFQAVAQDIAEVYICARAMRLATSTACRRLGAGHPADEHLNVAAYWLTEEIPVAMHRCQHLHGGIGVDIGYPMHRYYTLIKDLCRLAGGAEYCLERLGADLGAA